MKTPKNLLGVPKRSSGKDLGYQKNQNMVQSHEFAGQNPRVTRVKKIRAMAKPNPKGYANPVNMTRKVLKHVKPD